MEQEVDKDGYVRFENVPVGNHRITIPGWRDYLPVSTNIKMLEPGKITELGEKEYHAYVEIAKSGVSLTTIHLEWPEGWVEDETHDGRQKLERAQNQISVMALLVHPHDEEDDIDPILGEDSDEEWEQEFIFNPQEDHYQLQLVGGQYMIRIKYPGLELLQEHVVISPYEEGNTVLDYVLEEQKLVPIKVSVMDANMNYVPNTLVTMSIRNSKSYTEGLTAEDGVCQSFSTQWNNTYTFVAKKKGYKNAPVDILFTKENSQTLREIKLFLDKPLNTEKTMEVLVSSSLLRPNEDYSVEMHTCHSPNPDEPKKKEELVVSSAEGEDKEGAMIQSEPGFGFACRAYKYDHWFRLVIKVTKGGALDGIGQDLENYDTSFTSKIQSSNLAVQIFSHGRSKHAHVATAYPPSFTESHLQFWDIGFVNPARGKFIPVNAMSETQIERKTHQKFFMTFFKHLNKVNKFNAKKEFQFNLRNANFKFDDFYMPEPFFVQQFKQLQIEFITEKDASNKEKLEEKEKQLELFYIHVANSSKSVLGEVSLKKLKQLIEMHVGTEPTLGFVKTS